MTQVKMPEPLRLRWNKYTGRYDISEDHRAVGDADLITTAQAEAYADARVAESQQWISVDDRLPETNRGISGWTHVLAYWTTSDPDYEPGGIETSFFDGRNWQGANGDMDYHGARRVTHWMPLPEPPTE